MSVITIDVRTSDVLRRFTAMPEKMQDAVRRELTRFGADLVRHVKQDKLSGQVLKTRTGTLRRSINQQMLDTTSGLTLIVGTNVVYAAFHEFGFRGIENVHAYSRRTQKGSTLVRAHTRNVNYPPHSFLRSSLDDLAPSLPDYLSRATKSASRS